MPLVNPLLGMSCVMLTYKKQLAGPPVTNEASPEANAKPSQYGASQQAWRQALTDVSATGAPGDKAVPTREPTRSIRARDRNKEVWQYGEEVGTAEGDGRIAA